MSSPCVGHPCDGCRKCIRGRCCRGDNPDYALPETGSWTPIYGELGVVNSAGDTLECHACGGWYQMLGRHGWNSHDLTPAEYRAVFGLAHGQSLAGESIRVTRREFGLRYAGDPETMAAIRPTPERTSLLSSRPDRLQVRRSRKRERQRTVRAATAASQALPRIGMSAPVTCPDCGRVTMRYPSQVIRNYQRCRDCYDEARRNRMLDSIPVNAKIDEGTAVVIRQRYAAGGITQKALGAEHRVSQALVSLIVRGEVWGRSAARSATPSDDIPSTDARFVRESGGDDRIRTDE